MDVVAQRLQGRDIQDAKFIGQLARESFPKQLVQRCKKRSQRLAGACRRGDQRVGAGLNSRPTTLLRFGGGSEFISEPPRHRWMEVERLHRSDSLHAKEMAAKPQRERQGTETGAPRVAGMLAYPEQFHFEQQR